MNTSARRSGSRVVEALTHRSASLNHRMLYREAGQFKTHVRR